MTNRKRILLTAAILLPTLLALGLGIAAATLKTFALQAAFHISMRLLLTVLAIAVLPRFFRDQLNESMHKAIPLCGVLLILDLVVADGIRYILSGGTSILLFLPLALPAAFLVIMHYSAKDTGRDQKGEKRISLAVGIPLLMISLTFEILSFLN